MTADNVCQIVESPFIPQELSDFCLQFADQNAKLMLESKNFRRLSTPNIIKFISRDSFSAKEVDILVALRKWVDANPQKVRFSCFYMYVVVVSIEFQFTSELWLSSMHSWAFGGGVARVCSSSLRPKS